MTVKCGQKKGEMTDPQKKGPIRGAGWGGASRRANCRGAARCRVPGWDPVCGEFVLDVFRAAWPEPDSARLAGDHRIHRMPYTVKIRQTNNGSSENPRGKQRAPSAVKESKRAHYGGGVVQA